jgi:hypothetical protein
MAEVVVDTNVLLVADGKHGDATDECRLACIERLQSITQTGTVVIDDGFRIVREYQNKIDPNKGKGVGAVFLKWLLQNQANPRYVSYVALTEGETDRYGEFPVAALEDEFDPPDRKFPAVANAHPAKPAILQAVDCKWLRWWEDLGCAGIRVEFLCPGDICRFFRAKFPDVPMPDLP